jgi:hypothetical protein
MAFFLVGSPAANAFGSEVLGCAWNGGTWIANNCGGGVDNLTFFSAQPVRQLFLQLDGDVRGFHRDISLQQRHRALHLERMHRNVEQLHDLCRGPVPAA